MFVMLFSDKLTILSLVKLFKAEILSMLFLLKFKTIIFVH